MIFNSYRFIFLFLPVTLIIFFTLPQKFASAWLILASLCFYGSLSLRSLPLLVLSVLLNYCISLKLAGSSAKKSWLIVGLLFNFSVLGCFKLSGYLPLGISFYTFTQTAYLVEIYKGHQGTSGLCDYCRYVTFFGYITSGPIAKYSDTLPKFSPDYELIAKGITLFFLGMFKKVFIADGIAPVVNRLFAAPSMLNFSEAWLAALAYAMQLYFDFSGYSDMAIGVGLMFGMRLPQNFDAPYKSLSMIDFWRSWHMSLGVWVRDYIYIPLGGSREGELKRTRNVLLAMLFTGLWHGLGWTFILWGAVHGILLAVNHWWRRFGVRMPAVLSWGLTFGSVVILWVLFRSESLSDAGKMFAAMSGFRDFVILIPKTGGKKLICFALLLTMFCPSTRKIIETFKPSRLWLVMIVVLAVISFMNFSRVSDFLYFQF